MPPAANPEDERALAVYAAALADAIEAALPGWVERSVEQRWVAWSGSVDASVMEAAREAGARAAVEVGEQVRVLLALDIDAQRTNPLSLLRLAVRYATAVLQEAGVPPVRRDEFRSDAFPEDIYDLSPATFADVDPSLHEPGLVWGAAKAHVHLARHKRS